MKLDVEMHTILVIDLGLDGEVAWTSTRRPDGPTAHDRNATPNGEPIT
jgi:hypothetical protein